MSIEFENSSFRPTQGTKTGRVWEIADLLSNKSGKKAKRKAVIDAYTNEGGNRNTASKQYDDWQQEYIDCNTDEEDPVSDEPSSVGRRRLEIGADGRILIPAELREAMQVSPGDTVSVWVDEGELHIISRSVGLLKMRKIVNEHVPEGVSLVDDFIKEKRIAEAKEKAELEEHMRTTHEKSS